MAKLLLIADENRIGSSKRDAEEFPKRGVQKDEIREERQGKRALSVVARLMGLETMPSPEPSSREKKLLELIRNQKEAQSTKKLLQSKYHLVEKAGTSTRSMDTGIQSLKGKSKEPPTEQLDRSPGDQRAVNIITEASTIESSLKSGVKSKPKSNFSEAITPCNSNKSEDPKSLFFSKLPSLPPLQAESPFKSILSPSKTAIKLVSPIKSPLSTKSAARLFGAAAKILEPSLQPARHLGFHSQSSESLLQDGEREDMGAQKARRLRESRARKTSSPPPSSLSSVCPHCKCPAKNKHSNSEQKTSSSSLSNVGTECKGRAMNKYANAVQKRKVISPSTITTAEEPSTSSRQEEANTKARLGVKQEKESNNDLANRRRLRPPATSCPEANIPLPIGGQRAVARAKDGKALIKSDHCSEFDNAVQSDPVKEEKSKQNENNRRLSQAASIRSQSFKSPGAKLSRDPSPPKTNSPARAVGSLQCLKSSSQASWERMNSNGSRNSVKAGFSNNSRVANLSKDVGAGSKSLEPAQNKGPSSRMRSSLKTRVTKLVSKPAVASEMPSSVEGHCISFEYESNGTTQSFATVLEEGKPGGETDGRSCNDDGSSSSVVCNHYEIHATCSSVAESSSEADTVSCCRVRSRWEITDGRNNFVPEISVRLCESDCDNTNAFAHDDHSDSYGTRTDDVSNSGETTAAILHELLTALNASTPQLIVENLSVDGNEFSSLEEASCKGGSEAQYDSISKHVRKHIDLSADSTTVLDSFLREAERMSRDFEKFLPRGNSSTKGCESVSDSLCAEECGQPSPISILESPFQDAASNCSDSFETLQGRKQCEASGTELYDCTSTTRSQIEDGDSYENRGVLDGDENLLDTRSLFHRIDTAAIGVAAKDNVLIKSEEDYVKEIVRAAMVSAEDVISGRLALSSPLIDPALFNKLEEQAQHLDWGSAMSSRLCIEDDFAASTCRSEMGVSFMSQCEEATFQKRKLIFDCIDEALRWSLELVRHSYGFFSVPCVHSSTTHFLSGVYKQIDEWKRMAICMNLDDMMEKEINGAMGRWSKFGGEVEEITENIETVIFRGLIDELMREVVGKITAPTTRSGCLKASLIHLLK